MKKQTKIIISALALVSVLAGTYYVVVRNDQTDNQDDQVTSNQQEEPLVKQEQSKQQAENQDETTPENNTEKTTKNDNEDTSNTSQETTVRVVINEYEVLGENLDIFAGVKNVVEDGGICTFALLDENNEVILSKEQQGLPDFSDITCGRVSFDTSDVKPGNYIIEVGYASTNYESSTQQEIEL